MPREHTSHLVSPPLRQPRTLNCREHCKSWSPRKPREKEAANCGIYLFIPMNGFPLIPTDCWGLGKASATVWWEKRTANHVLWKSNKHLLSTNYILGNGVIEKNNIITIYWKPVKKPSLQFSARRALIVTVVIIPELIGMASSGHEISIFPIRVTLRAPCCNKSLFSLSLDDGVWILGPCPCQVGSCSKTEKTNRGRQNCRRREMELCPGDRGNPWIKLYLKTTFLLDSPFK